jgi:hypothetical protein
MAAGIEQCIQVVGVELGLGGALPSGAAQGVDDLVLEDPGEPGAQVRAPGEAFLGAERREERFLNGVFGRLAVTQLQRGEAQKVGPERFDFRAEIGAQTLGPS